MAKAIISIPLQVESESSLLTSILGSLNDKIFQIYGVMNDGSFSALVGADKIEISEITANEIANGSLTRELTVQRSGTRHRVLDGLVNLAEEAEETYKTFSSFGDFVLKSADGVINMGLNGGSPAVPENGGQISVNGIIFVGNLGNSGDFRLDSSGGQIITTFAGGEDGATVAAQLQAAMPGSSVTVINDGNEDTGVLISNPGQSAVYFDGDTNTYLRTGFTAAIPAVGGTPGNSIILDQLSKELKFVVVAAIPTGTVLASIERPISLTTSIFE